MRSIDVKEIIKSGFEEVWFFHMEKLTENMIQWAESKLKEIEYIHEPTDLQCGQAVLAMLTALPVSQIATELNNNRETNLKEMKSYLKEHGFKISDERRQAENKSELPNIALLSLETPRCWHWSLYYNGTFFDPEHGVMSDFPICKRITPRNQFSG